ncbi:uncharacterized protein LOC111042220 [Myzus persicae]|uniref:uncharacterized protein LOC111042220 n=1 Tax=Myzus persicae TaxID=13164 RepID=UPI000B939F80|nr:uncharacterized protein LOC111042220 [Myzus persicae]
MNNTFQKILKFPEKHFLAEILYAFTQSTYFDDDSEKKISTMLCVTLMQYFNSHVSKHLLYVNEKRFKLYRKDISDPFYIFDVGDLVNEAIIWQQTLPRVKPFYAVKCNDNSFVLETLAVYGTNFGCASKVMIFKTYINVTLMLIEGI